MSGMLTGRVRYGNGNKTASFSKGAIDTPKPPSLETTDSADTHTYVLSLANSPKLSLSECVIQIAKSIYGLRENSKLRANHHLSTCAYYQSRDSHLLLLDSSVLDD